MQPRFLYGTAWKEDRTAALVTRALDAGFRAIDTANQRKHYHEAGVGEAIAPFLAAHGRDTLFLQTKFTYARGQDHRLPYDAAAPVAEQVRQSFRSSLGHLGVDHLDALLLHGPARRPGLGDDDWSVWRTLESLQDEGGTRQIGVSNVDADQLAALCSGARILPAYVQNRCYASTGFDRDVRAVCARYGLTYQGFSLLTANRAVLPVAARIGAGHRWSAEQVIFRLAFDLGILPLTGSGDADHLRADLAVLDADPLRPDELAALGA
jgi:diketogulonate reductase-like aldo/keto reductase